MPLNSFKILLSVLSLGLILTACNDGPEFTVCYVYAADPTKPMTCRDPKGVVTERTLKETNNYACFSNDDIATILAYFKRNSK